jgi:hypothetical protein
VLTQIVTLEEDGGLIAEPLGDDPAPLGPDGSDMPDPRGPACVAGREERIQEQGSTRYAVRGVV